MLASSWVVGVPGLGPATYVLPHPFPDALCHFPSSSGSHTGLLLGLVVLAGPQPDRSLQSTLSVLGHRSLRSIGQGLFVIHFASTATITKRSGQPLLWNKLPLVLRLFHNSTPTLSKLTLELSSSPVLESGALLSSSTK